MFNRLIKPSRFEFISRLVRLNRQRLSTTQPKRGGGGHESHGHHEPTKDNLFMKLMGDKAHPREHQGYYYREAGNLQGRTQAAIAKTAIVVAWWWIFYHIFTERTALLFGHHEYPDTAKWTDAELGIPSGDE
jgi:hypothetical protein